MEKLSEFRSQSLQNQWLPHIPLPPNIFASDWPYLPIEFEADFATMLAECEANQDFFVAHRAQDKHLSYSHEGWSAVTLHGISPAHTEHFTQYGFESAQAAGYTWTSACDKFPVCTEFIKSLGYKAYDRVRIMRLAPGGYIMPHQDAATRMFGPLNIAINNPDDCEFYFRDWGRVPFTAGTGNFLDVGTEHAVWNRSAQARYHFIVHGDINVELFRQAAQQLLSRLGVRV